MHPLSPFAPHQTFISKEHEKTCYGDNTPGPSTAEPYDGCGKQLLSTHHSSPGWGFGTGRVSASTTAARISADAGGHLSQWLGS